MPGRFVGEPQAIADRPALAEHDQVRGRQVLPDTLRSQCLASASVTNVRHPATSRMNSPGVTSTVNVCRGIGAIAP